MQPSPTDPVRLTAPSRLHFGFVAFGPPHPREFAGIGVMLQNPAVRIQVRPSARLEVNGPHADRVRQFAERWENWRRPGQWGARIEVLEAPPQHVGLGVGTQLALATAEALDRLYAYRPADIQVVAARLGRARRSAVGTYGFRLGGCIVDAGKGPEQPVGSLHERLALPASWRFVLLRPAGRQGLAGGSESRAFQQLAPVPEATALHLRRLLDGQLLPAARAGEFERFSQALYEYGVAAGSCFASAQAGAFATRDVHDWIERLGRMGVRGRGQSSWGPTIFALMPDPESATRLVDHLQSEPGGRQVHLEVSEVAPCGARIERLGGRAR